MIVRITKLVGTPPRRVTADPVWASGAKVLRLRSGHTKLVLKTVSGNKFVDVPAGTEIEVNAE